MCKKHKHTHLTVSDMIFWLKFCTKIFFLKYLQLVWRWEKEKDSKKKTVVYNHVILLVNCSYPHYFFFEQEKAGRHYVELVGYFKTSQPDTLLSCTVSCVLLRLSVIDVSLLLDLHFHWAHPQAKHKISGVLSHHSKSSEYQSLLHPDKRIRKRGREGSRRSVEWFARIMMP